VLDQASFEAFCVAPVARIVRRVRRERPEALIVGFPRGAGALYQGYREATGVDAVGLDWTVPIAQAQSLQRQGAVQGNLDPLRLVAGGKALDEGVASILGGLSDGPLVFNLGHGIIPETPIAHVEAMLKLIRGQG
jgi:uroporphyrinogen decarboxylase